MHRSVRAALLSGLVFPGVGQLYLGRYLRACLFLLPALAAALYFSTEVMQPVLAIAREVQSGALPFDPLAIQMRLEDQGHAASPLVNVAALVMLAAWIGATIDAWFAGKTEVVRGRP